MEKENKADGKAIHNCYGKSSKGDGINIGKSRGRPWIKCNA